MLYKNNVNDTATLLYFNNGNVMLTSKGKLYSKLFEVFKNAEVFNAETISADLETDLKAVNAKMIKKGNQYKVFAVNKLPVPSNFELTVNDVNFNGNYTIETYSDNLSIAIDPILATNNSWNSSSGNGNMVLPASSISIITINESEFISLALSDIEISEIKIYPNPTNGLIYIDAENLKGFEYSILDASGKKIIVNKLISNTIDISQLASGFYIVRLSKEGNNVITKKVLKN